MASRVGRRARVRRWVQALPRRHPTVLDALLALVVFAVAVLIRPDRPELPELSGAAVVPVALASAALVLRRRYPIRVWALTLLLGVVGVVVSGGLPQALVPSFVALFTVASWRDRRVAVLAAVVAAAAIITTQAVVATDERWTTGIYVITAWLGMVTASGIAVRNRRAVVAAAVERARRAEQSREEEARRRVAEERLRIARELHDVVAHHMAVITVQAGVAQHLVDEDRSGAVPPAVRGSLGHVRDSAQVVLGELTTILGLLRASGERDGTQPAPRLAQLDTLVDSVRRTGLDVSWRVSGKAVTLPPGTDLVAYRLVQEALTNAGKHGTGSADVSVEHGAEQVSITVANRLPAGADPAGAEPVAAESGHGLVGMRERVTAVGGRVSAGPEAGDVFVVRAVLPVGGPR